MSHLARRIRPLLAAALATVAVSAQAQTAPSQVAAKEWPHQLTVFAIPAPWGMDWSSPRSLGFSGIKNKVSFRHFGHKHAIGHVFVHLQDPTMSHDVLTGMTTENQTEEIDLGLKKGYGLGVLSATMQGKFDAREKLEEDLAGRYRSGLISYVRFLVSPSTGARLARFIKEYEARGANLHYGGGDRPRYAEGGGCSAFGVSFIDVAGLMEPEYQDNWKVLLRIPERLFGGPRTGLKVPLTRLFAYGRWATEDEAHAKIEMWDPSLIHDWVQQTWMNEREDPSGRWTPELRGRARGLVVDARERPAPQEPIFLSDPPGTAHPYARQGGNYHAHASLDTSEVRVPTLQSTATETPVEYDEEIPVEAEVENGVASFE